MKQLNAQEMIDLFDKQLENAERIQKKIIPDTNTFNSSYYSFFSYLKPFRRVGGDFYDFRIFPNDCISLLLADATGHGLDAAMLTGIVKLIYSYALEDPKKQLLAGKIIKQIDKDIEILLDFSFFSCFSIILDPHKQTLSWSNAGHPPAYLIKSDNSIIELRANLPLIGMHSMFTKVDYSDLQIDFKPGDKLILYTDGLTDAKNQEKKEYGNKRILEILSRYAHLNIDTLCQILVNDCLEFVGENEASDDLCILGIQFD